MAQRIARLFLPCSGSVAKRSNIGMVARAALLAVALVAMTSADVFGEPVMPKLQPSTAQHSAFLINPKRDKLPPLVVFKDPFCAYCLRAMADLERIQDYNVFVFWAPLLGPASRARVADFFYCDSPVGEQVRRAVFEQRSPACTGPYQKELARLNREMVSSYQPQGVPLFYVNGRSVSLQSLLPQLPGKIVNTVVIEWPRYRSIKLATDDSNAKNQALVFPPGWSNSAIAKAVARHSELTHLFWWHSAHNNGYTLACLQQWFTHHQCSGSDVDSYHALYQEMLLLLGLERATSPYLINDQNIVRLTD